jgi:hypothetical protein
VFAQRCRVPWKVEVLALGPVFESIDVGTTSAATNFRSSPTTMIWSTRPEVVNSSSMGSGATFFPVSSTSSCFTRSTKLK